MTESLAESAGRRKPGTKDTRLMDTETKLRRGDLLYLGPSRSVLVLRKMSMKQRRWTKDVAFIA